MKTSTAHFSLPFAADTILFCNETKKRLSCKIFLDKAEKEYYSCGASLPPSSLPVRTESIQHSLNKLELYSNEISTFKEWVKHRRAEKGVAENAAVRWDGRTGINRIQEAHDLYNLYEKEIWGLLREYAREEYEDSVIDALKSFYCSDVITYDDSIKLNLVWFAARVYADRLREEEKTK